MKKKIAALLTAVMVMAMGTTALAAPSPTTDTNTDNTPATSYADVTIPSGGVVINGQVSDVVLNITAVTNAQVSAAQAQAVAQIAPTAKVLKMVDIEWPQGVTGKVQITFAVSGVTEGQKLAILHQKSDGSWEVITPDKVENGKVTATFTSLSPVAIVAYNASAQTGETASASAAVPFMMIICLAGIAICGKKVKFNN